MKKVHVFITGFESNNVLATSGWSWFFNKSDAEIDLLVIDQVIKQHPKAISYHGETDIEIPNSIDENTEYGKDYINNEVELFLSENDWENSFK